MLGPSTASSLPCASDHCTGHCAIRDGPCRYNICMWDRQQCWFAELIAVSLVHCWLLLCSNTMVCKGKTSGPTLATCAASSFSSCERPWPQLAQASLPATALEQLLCCKVEFTCRQLPQSADSFWHTTWPGCICTTAAGRP
jgi:hypothetical protein